MVALRPDWAFGLRIARGHHLVSPAPLGPVDFRSLDVLSDVQSDGVFESADPPAADSRTTRSAGAAGPGAPLSSRSGAVLQLRALTAALGAADADRLRADTSRPRGAGADRRVAGLPIAGSDSRTSDDRRLRRAQAPHLQSASAAIPVAASRRRDCRKSR